MDLIIYVLWVTYFFSLFFAVFWLMTFLTEGIGIKEKKLKKFPLISVVIPAYNEEKSIQESIKSVLKLDYPKNKLEIVVVNDGSKDGTREKVEEVIKKNQDWKIHLINKKNGGKGSALNAGLKVIKGKYFVCLDADSFVQKNALRKLLPHFDRKDVAAVLPALKVSKKSSNLLQKMQHYEYIINMFYKELMSKLDCIRVTPGPFSVYKTAVLRKVGGFDENRNLTEDLEMALRLQSYHYKIIQVLNTHVLTIAPKTLKGVYKQRNRWYKGSVLNTIKYRKMLLNRKYGDFGIMEMPTTLISGAIALILLFSLAYYTLKPIIINAYHLSLVNFDIITYIKSWVFKFHLLDLNYSLIAVGVIMFFISIYVLKKSHIVNKEKVLGFGLIPLAFYLFMYFFILAMVWLGIGIDLVLGRKQKW
ncbi:MAG: glycosyltransferase family 2 protein [Nanoarchaeota archaeon]|nr:glycosyltransferase family 2 protein [Nanoarchaeota archaeon]